MTLSRNTLLIHVPQHLLFGGVLVYSFTQELSFWWLLCTYLSWVVLGWFGFSVWYHRYFAHRSFKTYRWCEYVFGYLGLLVGRGSPINMASLHMTHHQYADTLSDPHSPLVRGWFFSWFSWAETHEFKLTMAAKHLLRDPYMRWLDRNYLRIYWGTFFILCLVSWKFALFGMMGAGVLHYHVEGAVNTLGHSMGTQNYLTGDGSGNIRGPFNWFTLGTGLHNNHHHKPGSYHYALMKGDFDLAKWLVPLFIRRG